MKDTDLFYLVPSDYATLLLVTEVAATFGIPTDWMLSKDDAPTGILYLDHYDFTDARAAMRRLMTVVGVESAVEVAFDHCMTLNRKLGCNEEFLGFWIAVEPGTQDADYRDFDRSFVIRHILAA